MDLHCKNAPVFGFPMCHFHGGPSPKRGWYGPGVGIVTGENSRFQITKLAAKYNELTKSGQFLSNRQALEIIRSRVRQLAERIDLNEAPDRLAKLSRLWAEYREQRKNGAELEALKTAAQIDEEFQAAYHDYAAWKQMFEALDLDRKMVESEVKIAKDMRAILTAEDAFHLEAKLLASIIQAASEIILDEKLRAKLLKRIEYEFARLIGDGDFGEAEERFERSRREIIDSVSSTLD